MRIYPARTDELDAGYTLLELLVVLAIVSLLLAFMPTLYGQVYPKFEVRQFANDLANFARKAREAARETQTVTGFLYSANGNTLIALDGELDVPSDLRVTYVPSVPWNSVQENRVEFYPGGGSSGGAFQLEKADIKVSVMIDWVSGAISVEQ